MKSDYFGKDLTPLKEKKLFLFDMDGTIYMENRLFNGVNLLLKEIEERGCRYVFVTNNSSKSVYDYIKNISSMGIKADENNFFTSTDASIVLLKDRFDGQLVYAQGTVSFIDGLRSKGIKVTTEFDQNASVVLVGFDPEITGEKLRTTCKMLTLLKEIPFYATNPDWVCPVEFGYVPDCGSMCFGIEKATGRTPVFIGKPNPMMINLAMAKFNAKKEQTLVIGDRLYTDIASGVNAKVDTALVLSGEATIDDYFSSQIKPTYVLEEVNELRLLLTSKGN